MTNRGGTNGGAGDPNRRPTKAERREEARLERERIQARMRARNRNRNLGIVLVALAAAAVVVVVFVVRPGKSDATGDLPSNQQLLDSAASAAKEAGCGTVQETGNYQNAPGQDPDIDHAHIGAGQQVATPPALSTYPTVPPASGPHDPVPLPAGTYDSPPNIYQTIHSMEHAGVIIWYAPSVAGSPEIARIKDFYAQGDPVGAYKVIVAPYDYPDAGTEGSLPQGVTMALVAWHRLQTCATPSLAAAFDFTSQYENPPVAGRTYKGVAREPNNSM